jgi:hypothetical protein
LGELNSEKPEGFVEALSFRVDALPWGRQGGSTYEDWYVVDSFGALGALNDATVTGKVKESHDPIAKDYMKGAGGVLRLIQGNLRLRDGRFATWIEKSIGPLYRSYYDDVAGIVGGRSTALWRRQMVLGPSPQFCVHSEEPLEFPPSFRPIKLKLEMVSPS